MTVVSRQGRSFNAFTLVLVLVVGFVTLLGAANLNSGPKTAVVLAGAASRVTRRGSAGTA
jgi:hypothetical protein